MNIPGFAAQASLYKSGQAYWGLGGGGNTAPRVVAALLCEPGCALDVGLCVLGCIPDLNPICVTTCVVAGVKCLNGCGGGGGAGGGAKGCCPIGKKCCGQCHRVPERGCSATTSAWAGTNSAHRVSARERNSSVKSTPGGPFISKEQRPACSNRPDLSPQRDRIRRSSPQESPRHRQMQSVAFRARR